jgi:[ribosomal protein S5]-alanine N-acetyltransferase
MIHLKTKRLIIRDLKDSDAKDFAEQGNDQEINYFNWYLPHPLTFEKARKIIKKRSIEMQGHRWLYELAIILEETNEFLGIVSLYDVSKPENKAKIGYWIGKNYRRKGYIEEAVKEMIKFAFQNLNLNKISAKCMADNISSINLLKKLNFRKIGIKEWDKIIEGEKHDVVEWEMLNKPKIL